MNLENITNFISFSKNNVISLNFIKNNLLSVINKQLRVKRSHVPQFIPYNPYNP